MDDALKIIRYTLAALMAGGSLIINANAATLHSEPTANTAIVAPVTE